MTEFTDKVVLVTGAGRGIGRAVSIAFAKLGAVLAANDITPVNLDETLRRIRSAGGRARDYIFDISKRMPVQAMVDQVLEELGRVDILVNCAEVQPQAPILDMDEWDWHRTLDVNLSGPFFTMQQVGRAMRQQGGGSVVNIVLAEARAEALKDRSAYITSKAGLASLTRTAAREFAPFNIRVNAVYPGMVEAGPISLAPSTGPLWENWLKNTLQAPLEPPAEVAGAVLFLCSQASAGLTGQVIEVREGPVLG